MYYNLYDKYYNVMGDVNVMGNDAVNPVIIVEIDRFSCKLPLWYSFLWRNPQVANAILWVKQLMNDVFVSDSISLNHLVYNIIKDWKEYRISFN